MGQTNIQSGKRPAMMNQLHILKNLLNHCIKLIMLKLFVEQVQIPTKASSQMDTRSSMRVALNHIGIFDHGEPTIEEIATVPQELESTSANSPIPIHKLQRTLKVHIEKPLDYETRRRTPGWVGFQTSFAGSITNQLKFLLGPTSPSNLTQPEEIPTHGCAGIVPLSTWIGGFGASPTFDMVCTTEMAWLDNVWMDFF